MQYVVFHTVRAAGRQIHTAKLVVTDVPEKTAATAVISALDAAGKSAAFSDAGIPWGNHEVKSGTKLPAGAGGVDDAPKITWEELQGTREIRRVTLRLQPADYTTISHAARLARLSMQKWCETTLVTAAEKAVKATEK
jgi:hypothetical protein